MDDVNGQSASGSAIAVTIFSGGKLLAGRSASNHSSDCFKCSKCFRSSINTFLRNECGQKCCQSFGAGKTRRTQTPHRFSYVAFSCVFLLFSTENRFILVICREGESRTLVLLRLLLLPKIARQYWRLLSMDHFWHQSSNANSMA